MRASNALGAVSGSQPCMKNVMPSLPPHFDSKVFILPSHGDFEFASVLTSCLARNFLHIVSLSCSPQETLTDQAQRRETNRSCVAHIIGGRRDMVNEKEVEVQSVNCDVARLIPD